MSKKLTIISCSSCDLKEADIKSNVVDFTTVPLKITINGVDWVDSEELDTKELIAAMKVNKDKPLTACPSPEDFADKIRAAKTDDIVLVTITSKLSGTYNSASLAVEMTKEEFPNKNIYVLDSLTATAGQTLLVHNVIRLAEAGYENFDDMIATAEEMRSNTKTRFFLQDLSNLVKTGRLSKVKGLIASVLNLRLICGDDGQGEIKQYAKIIGTQKALQTLGELPKEKLDQGFDLPIVINHAQNDDGLNIVKSIIEKMGFTNIKTYLMRGHATIYSNDQGIVLGY